MNNTDWTVVVVDSPAVGKNIDIVVAEELEDEEPSELGIQQVSWFVRCCFLNQTHECPFL